MRNRPTEQIIYTTRRHWAVLILPSFLVLLGLCCTGFTMIGATADPPPGQEAPPDQALFCMGACTTFIFVAAFLWVLRELLGFLNSEFILTTRRMIAVTGFGRDELDIPLGQIDSVQLKTSFLGNLLGYGSLTVRSGRSNQNLRLVANASRLRQHIQDQIARS